MANESPQNQTYPFRVFISHKVSQHGWAAENIKQELENYAKDKLSIFISPALGPGVIWPAEIYKEIEDADLFILLYLVEGADMDWCLYEAGYFEREARRTNRKLICVIDPQGYQPGPLQDRQRLKANEDGVVKLLRAIYADEHKPVRPDLFQIQNQNKLKSLIDFMLKMLSPVTRQPLSYRCWIKFSGDQWIEQLKNNVLVEDAHLAGESEALRCFGLGKGGSVRDFIDESEFKHVLEYYVPHVTNCLRRIIQEKPDPWIIPPVRLVKDGQPKALVPAYLTKGPGNEYKFEFIVYQPQPDYDPKGESAFDTLFNLFYLSWIFRRRFIEEWLETFLNLKSLGPRAKTEDIRVTLRRFKLAFGSLMLEAFNRNLDSPRKVEKYFSQEEDLKKLQKIMSQENGLYMNCAKQLNEAINTDNLGTIIDCLYQFRNINKTMLIMTMRGLQELVNEMKGNLI